MAINNVLPFYLFPTTTTYSHLLPFKLAITIENMCAELKDHNLLLVVSRKLMKGRRDNFVIYRLDKDMTLEACYKTFGELDEDFGHCIRAYGTAEGSKTYTEDKFLPFSSHLGRLKIK